LQTFDFVRALFGFAGHISEWIWILQNVGMFSCTLTVISDLSYFMSIVCGFIGINEQHITHVMNR